MLIQLSLSYVVCCLSTAFALGSPKWMKDLVIRVLSHSWLGRGSARKPRAKASPAVWLETLVSVAMLFLGLNGLLAMVRVVWFFFAGCGGCSWYGSLVLLLFPAQHVALFLAYMSTAAASLERSEIRQVATSPLPVPQQEPYHMPYFPTNTLSDCHPHHSYPSLVMTA